MNAAARPALAALAGLTGWALAVAPAMAAPAGFTVGVQGVKQIVGLAADPDGGRYWITDGTSATTSRLVAVDESGSPVASVSWGATPTSVQALSWADGQLFVGDIGDPKGTRSSIQVLSPTSLSSTTSSWKAWDLTYPDGKHDAAAMAVSSKGNIYVITRGPSPAIYRAPTTLSRESVNTLTKVASAPAGVTDATFLPDGARIALRTSSAVIVVDAYTWKTVGAATTSTTGGQALTTDLAQKGLEVGTTGSKVVGADIPTAVDPQATAVATASATPAVVRTTAKRSSGTLWAVLAASALAVVAGLTVGLWGRRSSR